MTILYKSESFYILNVDDDKSGWDLDLVTREEITDKVLVNLIKIDGIEHVAKTKYTARILIGKLFSKREVLDNIVTNIKEIFNTEESLKLGLESLSIEDLIKRKELAIKSEDYELAQQIENLLKNKL